MKTLAELKRTMLESPCVRAEYEALAQEFITARELINLPPLTNKQKARLAALSALPDSQIDTSDAPFRPDAVWVKTVKFLHAQ